MPPPCRRLLILLVSARQCTLGGNPQYVIITLGVKMRRLLDFAVAGAAAGAAAPAAEPPRTADSIPVEVYHTPDSTAVEDASELVRLFRSVLPESTAEEAQRWLGSADVVSGTHVEWAC